MSCQVFHLTRYAVIDAIFHFSQKSPLTCSLLCKTIDSSNLLSNFKQSLIFILTQSKISMSTEARSALNLYECAVSSVNANSTLWIFKEQPRIFRFDVNWYSTNTKAICFTNNFGFD
jgi:hypothetical protein